MQAKTILLLAGLAGASAVVAGSLTAHQDIGADQAALLQTAVRYHMYHALALLGVAALATQPAASAKLLSAAAWFFAAGIVLFSGGLYLRAGAGHTPLDAAVPAGGVSFIAGWLMLVGSAFAWRRS